jgi:hypothetical protein
MVELRISKRVLSAATLLLMILAIGAITSQQTRAQAPGGGPGGSGPSSPGHPRVGPMSAALAAAAPVPTSSHWVELVSSNPFDSIRAPAVNTDPVRGKVVLFGGCTSNQTWTWDGAAWSNVTPGTSPSARGQSAMAFDTVAGVMVLFGGSTGCDTGPLSDTWTWNGSAWTPIATAHAPAARFGHGMATDPSTGRVLLFGGGPCNRFDAAQQTHGCTTANAFGDIWTFNGSDWVPVVSSCSSSSGKVPGSHAGPNGAGTGALTARLGVRQAMATDPVNHNIVLYGGGVSTNLVQGLGGDTWLLGAGACQQVALTNNPPPRHGHALAYNSVAGASGTGILLFSGGIADFEEFQDTWLFNTSNDTWTQLLPAGTSPPSNVGESMATDPTTGTPLLIDRAETWRWVP